MTANRQLCRRGLPQEQIQIIATVIGKPKPNALRIVSANADSKCTAARMSPTDMTLLLRAPTSLRPLPEDERSICAFGPAAAIFHLDVRLRVYG